jgi:hypothetical protein
MLRVAARLIYTKNEAGDQKRLKHWDDPEGTDMWCLQKAVDSVFLSL